MKPCQLQQGTNWEKLAGDGTAQVRVLFYLSALVTVCVCETMCAGLRDSTRRLLSCVESEVGLEQKQVEDMPPVTGFTASVQGCVATLERQHGQET